VGEATSTLNCPHAVHLQRVRVELTPRKTASALGRCSDNVVLLANGRSLFAHSLIGTMSRSRGEYSSLQELRNGKFTNVPCLQMFRD
jgi:hypothetical protein